MPTARCRPDSAIAFVKMAVDNLGAQRDASFHRMAEFYLTHVAIREVRLPLLQRVDHRAWSMYVRVTPFSGCGLDPILLPTSIFREGHDPCSRNGHDHYEKPPTPL